MSILEFENSISKKNTTYKLIDDYKKGNKLNLVNSEKRKIHQKTKENISKTRFVASLNYIIVGLLYDKNNTIEFIRRKGVFRYSKYLKQKCIIKPLCENILRLSTDLNLDQGLIKYFNSIISLFPIYTILDQKRLFIIKEIEEFKKKASPKEIKKSFTKTLLAYVDYLFLTNYSSTKNEYPQTLKSYSKEHISEAVSFTIFLYNDVFGLEEIEKLVIDEDYILSSEIDKLLLNACHFKDLLEFEVMIDHFSYECIRDDQKVIIKPPIPEIEKSIRLGYIRTQLQEHYDFQKEYDEIASLENMVNKIIENNKLELVKYDSSFNYHRYIIEIPEPIFVQLENYIFKPNALFKEDIKYLSHIFKEQLLSVEKLKRFYVRSNLSLFDCLKIRRFFVFFYLLFSKNVFAKNKDNPGILLRSLIPSFKKDKLYKLLSSITTEEKLDNFLDIVTWNHKQKTIFDIQYQPFLYSDEYYFIPMSLFVNSNTIRNIFASEYKLNNPQIFDDGRYDPISERLTNIFQYHKFTTFEKIHHSFKNGGDIDFLAYKEDFLFVAECKNSLLPTGVYELRNVFDGINKARKQLDLVLEALKDLNTIKEISKKIDYDLKKIKQIKTAIITSNRLFVGLSIWKHPVRNISEFSNIIKTGNIETRDGKYSVWKNNEFDIDDLTNYLNDNGQLNRAFYDAMEERWLEYHFDNFQVHFKTYTLNIQIAELNFSNLRHRK